MRSFPHLRGLEGAVVALARCANHSFGSVWYLVFMMVDAAERNSTVSSCLFGWISPEVPAQTQVVNLYPDLSCRNCQYENEDTFSAAKVCTYYHGTLRIDDVTKHVPEHNESNDKPVYELYYFQSELGCVFNYLDFVILKPTLCCGDVSSDCYANLSVRGVQFFPL